MIRRRKKNRWRKVWAFLANILFIKIPIIDPERLLTKMYPYFRWIFTRTFITISTTLDGLALCLVVSQWKTFYDKLPDFQSFFNWWTIMSFWVCLAGVKIIHEFGHGLTAKHFGGEVHEMGILFLVLTPALYCDVTDSWLLPNKWKRIWISAAGIYVECFLASIATFVWWYSTPGLLNSLAMATMFICSVNTIMFNANPLLRYDGYYVMADWLEIPNLRIKSTQFFAYLIQEKVLGLEIPVQSYLPQVAAVLVRHVRGGQLHLSLVRHVRDPVVPLAGLEAIQARIGQLSSCTSVPSYPCWECRFIRSASSFALPGGCAK